MTRREKKAQWEFDIIEGHVATVAREGAPEAPLLSQDLPCLAHGQSLGGHPSPLSGADGPADGPASLRFGHRPDHDAPIWLITMGRRAHRAPARSRNSPRA